MSDIVITSAYSGEVLEKILVKATTGNEMVSRGLMRLEPGVSTNFYIPRMRAGKMLQKRKEQPVDADGKGDFKIDERKLTPQEFMAFTTFNPRSFEKIWRKWQPKGDLVFADLPAEAQTAMLDAMAGAVDFELGGHFINGIFGDDDAHLFNGILTRILADKEVINVPVGANNTQIKRLQAVVKAIPKTVRSNPKLRIIMSTTDADTYDDELTAQTAKGANYTDMNAMRFKGIQIEALAQWPDGVIVATYVGMDEATNIWGAVNTVNDFEAIKIDRLTNAGERYFFKMLMKADTNTAWGEDVVLLDARPATKAEIAGTVITVKDYVSTIERTPTQDEVLTVTGTPELGARLTVVNKATGFKTTVAGVEVPASKTVILAWDGAAWVKTA